MPEELGLLFPVDHLAAAEVCALALELERLGYDSIWVPELFGREPIATVGYLLAKTTRIGVATGIANVYARDAIAAAQARQTLAELSGGRFTLGLGVSHPPIAAMRGHAWQPPVDKLRAYIDAIEKVQSQSVAPAKLAPIVIAGHGPKLLALAAERADGAHTYLVTPEHTRRARAILGPTKSLRVVLPFQVSSDPARAYAAARAGLALYLQFPAYHRMWRTLGLADADWTDQASERLIDAVAACGSPDRVRARARISRRGGHAGPALSAQAVADRRRNGRCAEGAGALTDQRSVAAVYRTRIEAEIARARLEALGIPAWIEADDAGGLYPQFQLRGVRLTVSTSEKETAERILALPVADNDEARGDLDAAERTLRAESAQGATVSRMPIARIAIVLAVLLALGLLLRRVA